MPDDKVTIDPEFLPSQPGRNSQYGRPLWWVSMVAIVVVGGLSWMLRLPAPVPSEVMGSAAPPFLEMNDLPTVPSVLQQSLTDVPLREAVPGFTDTVTALIWGNHGIDIFRWPASLPVPEMVVSLDHDGGWNRSVDASGAWYVEIRHHSLLMTYHMNHDDEPSARRPQSAEIGWSTAWHDTRPGWLAWIGCLTQAHGSTAALYTADVSDPTAEPVALPLVGFGCVDPGVWLTRWGDWGTLLQVAEGAGTTQVLLSADGTELSRGRLGPKGQWFVGPGSAGTTIWTQGIAKEESSSFLLSQDGQVRSPVPGLDPGERLESALASPDGSLLALLPDLAADYGSVVRIVEADTGSVVAEIAEPTWWVTRMVWSTDGRFLVYERWPDVASNWAGVPGDVEVVFYDTESRSGLALPLPGYAPALRCGI